MTDDLETFVDESHMPASETAAAVLADVVRVLRPLVGAHADIVANHLAAANLLAANLPADGGATLDAGEPSSQVRHRDALADTGDAYHAFRGWVLMCQWCPFDARGKTKAEALRGMQHHYDAVLPEGAEIRG